MATDQPIVIISTWRARLWLRVAAACVGLRWFGGVEYCVERAAAAVRTEVVR